MFKNKKIVRAVALTLGLTITFSTPSYAFNSKGKIQYQNGSNSVVFDANDFSLIQNNITTGKQNIVDALKSIKSYMKADGGSVTGSEPTDKYTGNVADLTFTQLANAIENSQKIPSGKTAAGPDNITAGMSVWVDGELITGNGSDNAAYRNQGKQEGINQTKVGTAVAANVLEGKTFTNSSTVGATGTMKNNGAVTGTITTSGGSYTIPAGYHNGSGKVTGPTLAALVKNSNVTLNNASNLLSGVTAYGKDGVKYTGSIVNKGAWTNTPTTKGKVTIPAGYHNGSGYVDTTNIYEQAFNSGITEAITSGALHSDYMELILVVGYTDGNSNEPYAFEVFRQIIHNKNNIPDQQLLSGSGYYSTGWKYTITTNKTVSGEYNFSFRAQTPRSMNIWGRIAWL